MPLFPDNSHYGEAFGFLGYLKIWENVQSDIRIYRTIVVPGLIHAVMILLESELVLVTYLIDMARAIAGMRLRRRFAPAFFCFEYEAVSRMKYAI